jgi:hypothetical protein
MKSWGNLKLGQKVKLFLIVQVVSLQNVVNFGDHECHHFKFQNSGDWKSLKLWNRDGPTSQSHTPLNQSLTHAWNPTRWCDGHRMPPWPPPTCAGTLLVIIHPLSGKRSSSRLSSLSLASPAFCCRWARALCRTTALSLMPMSCAANERIASGTSCALSPRAEANLKSSVAKSRSRQHHPFPLLWAPQRHRPPLATDRCLSTSLSST